MANGRSIRLVWLAILLALVGADYATRGWIPVEPPASAARL